MANYALAGSVFLTSHYWSKPYIACDRSAPQRPEIDVAVRSGDYFVTLATSLETLASTLPDISTVTAGQLLCKIADDLNYLQARYAIHPKRHADDITELR